MPAGRVESDGRRTPPPVRAPTEDYGQRPAAQPPARRTIVIRGQVADRRSPRMVEVDRRRPPRRARERAMNRPDRVALWAVLLCLLLLAAAAASSHAATVTHRYGVRATAAHVARPR
jgi:hypothetical protein